MATVNAYSVCNATSKACLDIGLRYAVVTDNNIVAVAYAFSAPVAERIAAALNRRPLDELPDLAGAHYVDILVRRNGRDERYAADYLKGL